jgi:hypothetical protein
MTHIINGMAGNIESHSTLSADEGILNITAILDQTHYGFSKLTVLNATALMWSFVRGDDGSIGDELMLLKHSNSSTSNGTTGGATPTGSSVPTTPMPVGSGASRLGAASIAAVAGLASLAAWLL